MYPSDDGPIRIRLLITQVRAVHNRLEAQVAELGEWQARRLEAETPPPPPSQPAVEVEDLGGGRLDI